MAEKPVKVEIVGDSSGYKKALKEAEGASGDFVQKTDGHGKLIAAAAIGAGAAVGAFAKDIVGSASDYNETLSKTKVLFGEGSEAVIQFAEDAATNLGMSAQSALDAQADFAIFGQGAGLAGDELLKFSGDLTTLAADLASFHNTSPEQAIEAIGAAMRGEAEPIRAYGILLDDATLKQAALELGIYDGVGALTQQEKVLGAQHAIMKQSTTAAGDFAETSDGLAGKTKILVAQFENLKVVLGSELIPIVIEAFDTFNKFAIGGDAAKDSFKRLDDVLDSGSVADIANEFARLVEETGNARSDIDKAKEGYVGFFQELAGSAGIGDGATTEIEDMREAFADLADRSPEAAKKMVDSLRDVVRAADNGYDAAKKYTDQYGITNEVLDALEETLPHVESATLDATSGFEHMGLASLEAADGIVSAEDAARRYADQVDKTSRDVRTDIDAMENRWAALRGELDRDKSWIGIQQQVADLKTAIEAAGVVAKEKGPGSPEAIKASQDAKLATIDLKNSVIDYGEQIIGLPPEKVTSLLAEIDQGNFDATLSEMDRQLANHKFRINAHLDTIIIDGETHAAGSTTVGGIKAKPAAISGARAHGGPVSSGGAYLVGEEGPELLQMGSQGGNVIPNDALRGGGGVTIESLTIQMPVGSNGDDVVRAIKRFEARNGPGWRS